MWLVTRDRCYGLTPLGGKKCNVTLVGQYMLSHYNFQTYRHVVYRYRNFRHSHNSKPSKRLKQTATSSCFRPATLSKRRNIPGIESLYTQTQREQWTLLRLSFTSVYHSIKPDPTTKTVPHALEPPLKSTKRKSSISYGTRSKEKTIAQDKSLSDPQRCLIPWLSRHQAFKL